MAPAPTPRIAKPHHHAVKFYGDQQSLAETVARFIGEGLAAGQPAIILATPAHSAAILAQLQQQHTDVETARRIGDLVVLDADDMLSLFMVDDEPNAELFAHNVGGLIEQTLGGQTQAVVRAYGEMVDILWKQGRGDAAIKLEILWNTLAHTHGFALLCGYAIGSFYKQSKELERVVAQHSHVMRADTAAVPVAHARSL